MKISNLIEIYIYIYLLFCLRQSLPQIRDKFLISTTQENLTIENKTKNIISEKD